ncbi:MAG: sigma-70 family RNA polymerase sigma factor [Aureliella sp.]
MCNADADQPPSTDRRPPQTWLAHMFASWELPLLNYSGRLMRGDHSAAQDVVQEAFVKLCGQPWPDIEPHATAWLYRICRNGAIDLNRRRGRMNSINSSSDVAEVCDRRLPAPEERTHQAEQLDRVRTQIDRLPEQQQEILRLRLHDNLSYKQIAAVTGLTVTNVGYHLHQAIASLRAAVKA